MPRNLYNYFYYYAVCIYTHTHTHLSPRSDAVNFDTVKSAQFYFSVIRNGHGLYCCFFVRDKLYGHIFAVSSNIFFSLHAANVAASPVRYAFLLVKCMALLKVAVVVWQLLRVRLFDVRVAPPLFFFKDAVHLAFPTHSNFD